MYEILTYICNIISIIIKLHITKIYLKINNAILYKLII